MSQHDSPSVYDYPLISYSQRGFPIPDTLSRPIEDYAIPDRRRDRRGTNADSPYAPFHRKLTTKTKLPPITAKHEHAFYDSDDPSEEEDQRSDHDDEDDDYMSPPPSAHRPPPTKGILKKIQSMSNMAAYKEAGLSLHNDKPTWRDMERVIRDAEPSAKLVVLQERLKVYRSRVKRGYESPEEEGSSPESTPAPRRGRERETSGQTIRPTPPSPQHDDEASLTDDEDLDDESNNGNQARSPPLTSTTAMSRDHVIRYWKTVAATERVSAWSAERAAAANKAALSTSARVDRYLQPKSRMRAAATLTPATASAAAGTELEVPDLDKTLSRDTIATDLQTNESQQSSASNTSTAPSIASVVQQWRPTWEQDQTRAISKKTSNHSIHRRTSAIDVGASPRTSSQTQAPESPGTARSGEGMSDGIRGVSAPIFAQASNFTDSQADNLHLDHDDSVHGDTTPELGPLTEDDLPLPPLRYNALPPLVAQNSNTEDMYAEPSAPGQDEKLDEEGPIKSVFRKRLSSMALALRSNKRKDERKSSRQASNENEGIEGRAPTAVPSRATSSSTIPFTDPNPLAQPPLFHLKRTDTHNPIYPGMLRHYRSIDHSDPKHLESDPDWQRQRLMPDRRRAPGVRVLKALDELDHRLNNAKSAEKRGWADFSRAIERNASRSELP